MFSNLAVNALPAVVPILLRNYLIFAAVGLGLILIATLGHLVTNPE
jgi:hypothetical protein